jgi:hypothetical protein
MSAIYLLDTSGQQWQLVIDNSGELDINPVSGQPGAVAGILLNDIAGGQTWNLIVQASSQELHIDPVAFSPSQTQLVVFSIAGNPFGLQVNNGELETLSLAFPIPKFAYGSGAGIDFIPTYPPTKKTPYAPLEATRHDSITSSGIKQSVWERTDTFVVLQFETVPESDLPEWQQLFAWILEGNQFTYYPSSLDETTFQQYTIEDMSWTPTWKSFQTYAFTMKMRLVVGAVTAYFS